MKRLSAFSRDVPLRRPSSKEPFIKVLTAVLELVRTFDSEIYGDNYANITQRFTYYIYYAKPTFFLFTYSKTDNEPTNE